MAPTVAHDKTEHNEEIEYVLFGDRNYAISHPTIKHTIEVVENAVYLCIDQFNGSGSTELDQLKAEKIPNLPGSLSEIDFTSNYSHRYYTHRGWNISAVDDKANFPKRKELLKATIRKMLFASSENPIAWFPWASDLIYGANDNEKKAENLSILIYYVHILGDHLEAEKASALNYVAPLSRPNDRDNPGLIPEIKKALENLFADQIEEGSEQFKSLSQELDVLIQKSESLVETEGGVRDEQFAEYHKCAEDLLETLAAYVPELLKKEDFFKKTIYE